jgi:hypothetical protein
MIPEYFTNNIIFLTSVDVLGRTIIHNTLDVYRTLMVGESSAAASTLYVNEKVGILTETPNVELTVNGKISSNSIIYDEIGNSTQWNSAYTTYNANSSDYTKYEYVNNNFLPLSGGTVIGDTQFNKNVTIWGVLSATGGTYFANTIYSTTSALSVVHVGSGPALYVGSTGTGDIASFYDLDQNVEMLHIGGHDGDYPNVGIKTSTPNKDFTVNGEISASRIIWTPNGNSDLWNTTYNNQTNYLPLSGGTLTGKLVAAANNTASKLNIGNNLSGSGIPTTVTNGDLWINDIFKLSYRSNSVNYHTAVTNLPNTFNSSMGIDTSNTTHALRVTQRGTGNALVVEDDTSPDNTPFVINNLGSVGIGLSSLSGIDAKLTVIGNVSATGSYFGDGSKLTGIVAGDTIATTLVRNNSANWDSVYTTVQSYSATEWDNTLSNQYTHLNFLPLSGGIVTGDLIVDNTLQVGDGNPIFDFIITEDGNVGINTETPNEKLTVVGNISCTGLLYGDGSNLTGIVAGDAVATTLVRTNSANWNNSYTTVQAKSATEWNNDLATSYTRTYFLPLSGGNITESLSVDKNVYVSGVISASASNVKINIINDSISRTFTDDDNNKVVHLNTTSCPLCAIFPNNLSSGFNVAIMNIGTNNLILSAADLKSAGTIITTQYGGAFVYKELNDIFAVGRLV